MARVKGTGGYDVGKVRALAMEKGQSRINALREAGLPITPEIYSDVMRLSFAEAREEVPLPSMELTPEQMELVKQICEPCAARFTVKSDDIHERLIDEGLTNEVMKGVAERIAELDKKLA